MKFIIREANNPFVIVETRDVSTIDDLKYLQETYGDKLIVDFKKDWFSLKDSENHNMPSIMVYNGYVE